MYDSLREQLNKIVDLCEQAVMPLLDQTFNSIFVFALCTAIAYYFIVPLAISILFPSTGFYIFSGALPSVLTWSFAILSACITSYVQHATDASLISKSQELDNKIRSICSFIQSGKEEGVEMNNLSLVSKSRSLN